MNKGKNFKILILFLWTLSLFAERSPFRPYDGSPIIITNWIGSEHYFYLQDSHLEVWPVFKTFDKDYFFNHLLPTNQLSFRYKPEKTIDPEIINTAVAFFFKEVCAEKKQFRDFVVLKKDGFNIKKQAGLLVVKGKKWPLNQFVVKLFMETPRSFIRAYNKGFIAACHFIVGHGITRFMLGFTRLKNKDLVQRILQDSSENDQQWLKDIDIPRKWFWIPQDYSWIHIEGYYINGYDKIEIDVPGAYAIIEDAINIERDFSIKNKDDCNKAVEMCNALYCLIDPHLNNFVFEKDTNRIIIIDTEHLPTMVSLKEPVVIKSYRSWYSFLVTKGLREYFLRSKKVRKALQKNTIPPYQGPEKYLKNLT